MEYITAGESHGPELTAIITGVPAGLSISEDHINADLARRQGGYGRGGRQTIERDTVSVRSGLRFGRTLGSPITVVVKNKDWVNWSERMAPFGRAPEDLKREITPRPGHADLVGALKTNSDDCRNILERASARETAARVAATGIARELLAELGVEVRSYVVSVGDVCMNDSIEAVTQYSTLDIELSEMRCPDPATTEAMEEAIKAAKKEGESLGGTFRIVATGLVPGLGSYTSGSERLTSRIAAALFGIPAMKGVEFGLGFECARRPGSQVHDPIILDSCEGFMRSSNNAGGLEGGMTNGMPLVATVAMKPIPTLMKPLDTVNLDTLEVEQASKERSDVCAVPAAAVVAEGEVAFVLANAYLEAFGCTNMTDLKHAVRAYRQRLRSMSR